MRTIWCRRGCKDYGKGRGKSKDGAEKELMGEEEDEKEWGGGLFYRRRKIVKVGVSEHFQVYGG